MGTMDLQEAFKFALPNVREAAIRAAEQLSQLGIRYALAGGLAVGALLRLRYDRSRFSCGRRSVRA